MRKEYYRIRVPLDPELENEEACIEYIESFGEKKYEVVRELLVLGLEVKKGNSSFERGDIEGSEEVSERIASLEEQLKKKEKECEEKGVQIVQLQANVREYEKKEEQNPVYDEIVPRVIPTEGDEETEKIPGKKKNPGKKKKQQSPEVIKYEVREKRIDDYKSLEEYVIGKNLDAGVMSAISCALECHISYSTILSMIENGLNAKQMRGVIDLILAKRKRDKAE